MRHRVAHRKLGRVTEHRLALLRNQAEALLRHERIETTVPKAKELRPFVEHIITIAKRGIEAGENGRALQARRLVLRDIPNKAVVGKLFDVIAPRFAERPGGYTRLLRIGFRRGDNAEMAQVELIGSEYTVRTTSEPTAKEAPKAKGVGGRLRAAAQRMRGTKKEAEAESPAAEDTEDSPRKRRAPRKGVKKSTGG